MEKQKRKEERNNTVRLLNKRKLCFVFLAFLFFQKFFSIEIIIPKTKSIVGELVSIKVLLNNKNFAHIKHNIDSFQLVSTSEFEIINCEIKKEENITEILFEIKIFSQGENIFNILFKDKQINQVPIKILTSFGEINETTKFVWKIYSYKDKSLVEKPVQGEKYFLILYGTFKNSESKITKVEWTHSENILLDAIESNKNLIAFPLTQVIGFNFIPLHYSTINLPEIKIFYSDAKKKEKTIIIPTENLSTLKNTSEQKNKPQPQSVSTSEKPLEKNPEEKILLAKENHKLRSELNKSPFKLKNIFKINEVEKKLKIKNSFFAGKKYLSFLIFILLLLVLLFLLIKFKLKKNLIDLLALLIFILSIVSLKNYFMKYAVVCSEYDVLIKTIPETRSESVVNVAVGETLIVKSVLNNWCYVKTSNNFEGWVEEKNILFIDK